MRLSATRILAGGGALVASFRPSRPTRLQYQGQTGHCGASSGERAARAPAGRAAGSAWPWSAPIPDTRRRCLPAASARRSKTRSPLRPVIPPECRRGVVGRALGKHLQERVRFSRDVKARRCLARSSSRRSIFLVALAKATASRFALARRGRSEPAAAAASRARRHSTTWLEYRPSRRSKAPLSPSPSQASYSATILNLYSELKVRRLGLSGSWGASSPTASSWARYINSVGIVSDVYLVRSRP